MTEIPTQSRQLELDKPSLLADDIQEIRLPMDRCDLAAQVSRLLVSKAIAIAPFELDTLHLHIPLRMQVPDEYGLNEITKLLYDTDEAFKRTYLEVIKYLAREVFPFEFLYQETPTMRFHFPVPFMDSHRDKSGNYLGHHNDGMLGHSFEEINCWFPLTNCSGTAALQIAGLTDSIELLENLCGDFGYDTEIFHERGRVKFDEKLFNDEHFRRKAVAVTKARAMEYGELLIFDSRCIHATAENIETKTRVSADFRLIPLDRYEQLDCVYVSRGRSKRKFVRGDIFSRLSSADLLGHVASGASGPVD